jgi:hypothetical protein
MLIGAACVIAALSLSTIVALRYGLPRHAAPTSGITSAEPADQSYESLSTQRGRGNGSLPSRSAPPTVAVHERSPSTRNLTGQWEFVNEVHSTTYAPYEGLRLVYRLELHQDGSRVVGEGEKLAENGRPIPAGRRTPITVAGSVDGTRASLAFTERGHQRSSRGMFVLQVASKDLLQGEFESDVAHSRGSSIAMRTGAVER